MKKFKYFLRKIDLFGAPFNFKYKKSEKYSTPLGGLIILIFIILSLAFGIYYLIPFLNRKNLSIIYYTMNLPKTEKIRLRIPKLFSQLDLIVIQMEDLDPMMYLI